MPLEKKKKSLLSSCCTVLNVFCFFNYPKLFFRRVRVITDLVAILNTWFAFHSLMRDGIICFEAEKYQPCLKYCVHPSFSLLNSGKICVDYSCIYGIYNFSFFSARTADVLLTWAVHQVNYCKWKKGWGMNCDVGKPTEGLENELWCRWSDRKVGEWAELIDIEINSRVHAPTFPSLHLRHSSFSNPSIASPTSQFTLQPFFRFSYVTSSSLNSPGEPPTPFKRDHPTLWLPNPRTSYNYIISIVMLKILVHKMSYVKFTTFIRYSS